LIRKAILSPYPTPGAWRTDFGIVVCPLASLGGNGTDFVKRDRHKQSPSFKREEPEFALPQQDTRQGGFRSDGIGLVKLRKSLAVQPENGSRMSRDVAVSKPQFRHPGRSPDGDCLRKKHVLTAAQPGAAMERDHRWKRAPACGSKEQRRERPAPVQGNWGDPLQHIVNMKLSPSPRAFDCRFQVQQIKATPPVGINLPYPAGNCGSLLVRFRTQRA